MSSKFFVAIAATVNRATPGNEDVAADDMFDRMAD